MITKEERETSIRNRTQTEELADVIVSAVHDIKGRKVTLINMESLESAPASLFVICQGKSTTQVNSIADNIIGKVREQLGLKPYSVDGMRNAQWIVIDYGSVVVHLFLPETHDLYNLEDLWSDADIKSIPDMD